MRAEVHKKIMEEAARFLLLPEELSNDLIRITPLPDEVDKGMARLLRHIFVPIPGGHIGDALKTIMSLLDELDPVRNIAFASHYLVDICSPYHTSPVVETNKHQLTELEIEKHFDEWISEYVPHPPKLKNLATDITRLAKESQDLTNKLIIGYAKYELLGKPFPHNLMKESLFRAIDWQIGFLQYAQSLGLLKSR